MTYPVIHKSNGRVKSFYNKLSSTAFSPPLFYLIRDPLTPEHGTFPRRSSLQTPPCREEPAQPQPFEISEIPAQCRTVIVLAEKYRKEQAILLAQQES